MHLWSQGLMQLLFQSMLILNLCQFSQSQAKNGQFPIPNLRLIHVSPLSTSSFRSEFLLRLIYNWSVCTHPYFHWLQQTFCSSQSKNIASRIYVVMLLAFVFVQIQHPQISTTQGDKSSYLMTKILSTIQNRIKIKETTDIQIFLLLYYYRGIFMEDHI